MAKLLALAAVLLVAGCSVVRPAEPSTSSWDDTARQAITDMASEVATARVVVGADRTGDLVGRYAVVQLTYAEDAAGRAVDQVSTLQPPPGRRGFQSQLVATLGTADDAVTAARVATTAKDGQATRKALSQLRKAERDLKRLDARVGQAG